MPRPWNPIRAFDKTIVKTHSQPSSHGMLYRSEKRWPISHAWPYRRPLLAASAINVRAILWNNEKRDETHINERLHWSVIDRLNRGGLVDGKGQGPVKYQVHLYKRARTMTFQRRRSPNTPAKKT